MLASSKDLGKPIRKDQERPGWFNGSMCSKLKCVESYFRPNGSRLENTGFNVFLYTKYAVFSSSSRCQMHIVDVLLSVDSVISAIG